MARLGKSNWRVAHKDHTRHTKTSRRRTGQQSALQRLSWIDAFRIRGDEIIAHGHTNAQRQGTLTELAEHALIADTTSLLTHEEGKSPLGWLGPWISQSRLTPDLLAEAGYHYLLDWCHDDQPTWLTTRNGGRILAVPYPQELNDIPAIISRKDTGHEFANMIVDTFDEMLDQSVNAPLVMGIALHPYIVGRAHRLRPLRKALQHIASHPNQIWITTPAQIATHAAQWAT